MAKKNSFVLFAAVGLWAASAYLTAQEDSVRPIRAEQGGPPMSLRSSCGLQVVDGDRLLGMGPDYNAWFLEQGMSFTPALGKQAPHDLPLVFTTTSIGRGDTLSPVASATRSHADRTVSYHRGSMVETYEVRPECVKQSFVFHELPAGSGDLVVRGLVTSALRPGAVTESGVVFEWPGVGGVQIGGVVGIDARGQRAVGSLSLGADGIEFRLPAGFVDSAVMPLVLDPPFGTSVALGGTNDDAQPDLAWDATNGCYLAVWQRTFSFTNTDIRGQRLDTDGGLLGATINIESNAATVAVRPRVANINGENEFVVAYSYGGDVFARGVSAAAGALTAETILATGSNNQIEPVVGGEALDFVGGQALAVWRDATMGSILARPVGYTLGSLTLGSTATVSGSGLPLSEVAVSRSGGEAGRWLITWTRDAAGVADIYGRSYQRGGGFATGSVVLVDDVLECRVPAVDGDGINWVLAFARNEGGIDYDVLARPVRFDGTTLIVGTIQPIAADNNDNEYLPSVAWIGNSALVGWNDESAPGIFDTYVQSVDPFGCTVCEGSYSMGVTASNEIATAIASKASGGQFGARDAAVMWHLDTLLGDVVFWRWRAKHGAYTSLGGGCGSGGQALASCAINPNTNFRVRLRSGPPSVTVWGIISFDRNDYVCSPCTLIADPFSGVVWSQATNSLGDVSLNLPLLSGTGGVQFYLQYVSLQPTCALGIETSSAILVGIEN